MTLHNLTAEIAEIAEKKFLVFSASSASSAVDITVKPLLLRTIRPFVSLNRRWADRWQRGTIHAGREHGEDRTNPHEQVRDYALKIKEMLIQFNRERGPRSQWLASDVEEFYIDTAVCFTHPKAQIDNYRDNYDPPRSKWEKFSILKPAEIVTWAYGISFEVERYVEGKHQSYLFTAGQIESFVTNRRYLGLTESKEIPPLMPAGKPYGWLVRIENNQIAKAYPLDREEVLIGRLPTCQVSIPPYDPQYRYVSQRHARITHRLGDHSIFIEDIGSSHGTYINADAKNPVQGRRLLKWEDQITLGGPTERPGVCLLRLTKGVPPPPGTAYK